MLTPLEIAKYRNIVILTGAGISVASGLRPYRGPNGLWEDEGTIVLANAETLQSDPAALWRLFGSLRTQALAANPNAAHLALAEFEKYHQDNKTITLITQNIDGLHQRAGSKNVIELHGSAFRTKCSNPACKLTPFVDHRPYNTELPRCPVCLSYLRPDIVLFDEYIPGHEEWHSKRALRECDLFIAIGTSGSVSPASNFVRSAEYVGAETIFINVEPITPPNPAFHQEIIGKAEALLPQFLGLQ